ncbi:hypothetical protein GYMLUDRAFT_63881 [Collybiopsis luxurians FD-317 M1]|uniref:Uncharacterized protein n=1 Tax=Collybiopsis luxurians FD-317 M1 TaxID=944289 RepID=A0A0D0C5K5_9AGAR|nr:hypothetical protein GYMLUDRAFT_63881 [Collybiopsis luxurians FD-317 M1]
MHQALESKTVLFRTNGPIGKWVSQADLLQAREEIFQTKLTRPAVEHHIQYLQTAGQSKQEYQSTVAQINDLKQKLIASNEQRSTSLMQLDNAIVEIERLRAKRQSTRVEIEHLKKALEDMKANSAQDSCQSLFNRNVSSFQTSLQLLRPAISTPAIGIAGSIPTSGLPYFTHHSTGSSASDAGQSHSIPLFEVEEEEDYSRTAGLDYLLNTSRKTLNRANVTAALQDAQKAFAAQYPSYKLGPELVPHLNQHPKTRKLWKKNKQSVYAYAGNDHWGPEVAGSQDKGNEGATREHPERVPSGKGKERATGEHPEPSGKGKEQATGERSAPEGDSLFSGDDGTDGNDDQELSSESESDETSDEEVEHNDSEMQCIYARQGILCELWDHNETRRQILELGQLIIQEALHVEHNNEAFTRRGTSPK